MADITQSPLASGISLSLSGGGARGTFHLGFIHALQEYKVEIKVICGTSAGAIVGGAIACGIEPKEVLRILKTQEFKNIFKFNWFRKSVFKIDYNAEVMNKLFCFDNLSQTKIPFYVCLSDMESGECVYLNEGDAKSLITASCSVVPLFEPFVYENKFLVDGGVLDMMPTTPLVKYDYPILGINLMPNEMPIEQSFLSLTKRIWHLLLTSNLPRDIKRCTWNIAPFALTEIRIFSLNNLQAGFDLGYEQGLKWCEENLI